MNNSNRTTRVEVTSFGYLHGDPPPGHITVDVRDLLRNPHVDPGMRELTGFDKPVRDLVVSTPGAHQLVGDLTTVVCGLAALGRGVVRVGFGCAGGRHRSVVLARELTHTLAVLGVGVSVTHRDAHRPVVQTPERRTGMGSTVFLGGSCGTGDTRSDWRDTTAIPLLERAGIDYYNPQLPPGQWNPGMIAVERQAKEDARYVLMVIGGTTRGVASIQEATQLAMQWHDCPDDRKDLFLVIDDVPEGTVIDGVPVVGADLKDTNRARAFLRDMIEVWRPDLAVHPTVEHAVQAVIACYRDDQWTSHGR